MSLLLNISSQAGESCSAVSLALGVEILCELIGIFGENRTPVLNLLRFIGNSSYREEMIAREKQNV